MRSRALILAVLVSFLVPGLTRADPPPTLVDYRRAVDDAIHLVEQAAAGASPVDRMTALDRASQLLGSVTLVQMDEGPPAPVSNAELVQELSRKPSDLKPILARLNALRDSLSDPPVSPGESDRARLKDLLSRPPFKTNAGPDLFAGLLQNLIDFLDRLSSGPVRGVLELRDWITLVGLALVTAVVAYLIMQVRRNMVDEETVSSVEGVPDKLTYRESMRRAQDHVRAGDYRAAVRQLYLAALLLLDERGRIVYDTSRTNHEYLQSVARDHALHAALEPIVATFERTWYGFEPITLREFEAYRQRVDDVGSTSTSK